jgi:DNA-binding NtrC family response regulator
MIEYGTAIFRPGDVEVPLLLPADVVTELQSLDFAVDSARAAAGDSLQVPVPNTDSIRAQVERQLERVDSIRSSSRRFADSIRAEARRQMAEQANPE